MKKWIKEKMVRKNKEIKEEKNNVDVIVNNIEKDSSKKLKMFDGFFSKKEKVSENVETKIESPVANKRKGDVEDFLSMLRK